MKKVLVLLIVVLIGVGGFFGYDYLMKSESVQVEWIPVLEEEINRTVSDRGMVAASKISLVQTSTGGSILFLRKNGEKVKKGEVVARVDTSNYDDDIAEIALDLKAEELTLSLNRKKAALIESSERNRMLEKQKSYEHALLEKKYEFSKPLKSTMRKLVIQLELKKLDLEEADSNLKRQTNLYNKGFLSKASLEPFERRFETAKEKVNEAKLDISIAKKVLPKSAVLSSNKMLCAVKPTWKEPKSVCKDSWLRLMILLKCQNRK